MKKELIDWMAYKEFLLDDLLNEKFWALGSQDEEIHLQNIRSIQESLKLLEDQEFDALVNKYKEIDDYWDDFCLDIPVCPHCGSDEVSVWDRNFDTYEPTYKCFFCDTEFTNEDLTELS